MTISSIGSSSYYAGQLSTMRNRAASEAAETTGGKEKPTLAQLFTKLDADGSGSLESTEVQSLTEKISEATGISVDLAEFFSTYDADSDGALSQDEAVTALEANRPQGPPPPMGKMEGPESDMVSSADVNGDGVISAEEAEGLVSIINQANGSTLTAEDLLSSYDSDDDGTFSTDEAVAALEANRPQGPPPSDGGTAETEEVDALTTAAIEKYLEMAALGMGQQASGDIFSMFGDRNGSVNDVA